MESLGLDIPLQFQVSVSLCLGVCPESFFEVNDVTIALQPATSFKCLQAAIGLEVNEEKSGTLE